jgi:hypothetical protein
MADGDDIQRLEARLAELERLLQQSTARGPGSQAPAGGGGAGGGGAAGGGAGPGSSAAGGAGETGGVQMTPGAWLAGALARSLPQQGPLAQSPVPAAAQQDTGDTVWWCCSRFICVTTQCGTGGWC